MHFISAKVQQGGSKQTKKAMAMWNSRRLES